MPRAGYLYFLQALLVFTLAFGIRVALVDTYYQYSFEPDSESCVEETRSFYFFFEHPCKENVPHTLTSYPNYSDGDFIVSGLVANLVRPLSKAHIIHAQLSDGDNSIIIYSMRWTGVVLDALAAVIAFLVVLLLTGNSFIALSLTLLYYLLNQQTLFIDLIRIDHYTLLAANLALLATVLLFKFPGRKRYYVFAGLAAGLVSATKINFPFYLIPMAIAFVWMLFQRKISVVKFILLAFSFLFTAAAMYHRWWLYPENIWDTVKDTLQIGESWFGFWGNSNFFYYLWGGFLAHGFSWMMLLLLLGFYASFVCVFTYGVRKKDPLKIILCIAFLLQVIALMISPKISRYGTILPLWVIILIGLTAQNIWQHINTQRMKMVAQLAMVALLLPSFVYELNDYAALKEKRQHYSQSIAETRVKAFEFVRDSIPADYIIAYQSPKVSNPPIFELPLRFEDRYLSYPFLDKAAFLKFAPPSIHGLEPKVNYLVISDKEKNYHFSMFRQYGADSSLIGQWSRFYDSLGRYYPHVDFSSKYENYGVKSIHIYRISPNLLALKHQLQISGKVSKYGVTLQVDASNLPLTDIANFQVQVAGDSAMQWLVSGSRDGYPSKYRELDGTVSGNGFVQSMVPSKIMYAMMHGGFPQLLGSNPQRKKSEVELFFRKVLNDMSSDRLTFMESFSHYAGSTDLQKTFEQIDSLYPGLLTCQLESYLSKTGLPYNASMTNTGGHAIYEFVSRVQYEKGKTYYWRTRLRFKDNIMSGWSKVGSFKRQP